MSGIVASHNDVASIRAAICDLLEYDIGLQASEKHLDGTEAVLQDVEATLDGIDEQLTHGFAARVPHTTQFSGGKFLLHRATVANAELEDGWDRKKNDFAGVIAAADAALTKVTSERGFSDGVNSSRT